MIHKAMLLPAILLILEVPRIYTVLENGVLLDTWGCYEYGSGWTIEGMS